MSIIGSNILAGSSGQGGGYEIDQSLRFNRSDNPYLQKTFSSSPTSRRIQTWSFWVKRAALSGGSYGTFLVEADAGGSSKDSIAFNTLDELSTPLGDGTSGNVRTSALFRDFF
jgi:hypothetical protein